MKLLKTLRRFAIPGFGVTDWYLLRQRAMVSPRAEVESDGSPGKAGGFRRM